MIRSHSGRLGAMVVRYKNRFRVEVYTTAAGKKMPAWVSPSEFRDKEAAKRHAEYVLGLRDCK